MSASSPPGPTTKYYLPISSSREKGSGSIMVFAVSRAGGGEGVSLHSHTTKHASTPCGLNSEGLFLKQVVHIFHS